MASGDVPNPLRPYYRPPSIEISDPLPSLSAGKHIRSGTIPSTSSATSFSKGLSTSTSSTVFGNGAYTDLLSDPAPGFGAVARTLLDQAMWKYTATFVAQPFEVAKTVLQCRVIPLQGRRRLSDSFEKYADEDGYRDDGYRDVQYSDSDEELPFFTSSQTSTSRSHTSRSGTRRISKSPQLSTKASHELTLVQDSSLKEVLAQIWRSAGMWGIFKGTNTTFIYTVMYSTLHSWTGSALAALFGVVDPQMAMDLGSGFQLSVVGITAGAAVISGLVLAPIDIVRTRLILTPTSFPPRQLLPSLKLLPSLICPASLVPITALHSAVTSLFNSSTPLFLKGFLGIDPISSPSAYSFLTASSALLQLCVQLPLETILRRAQIALPTKQEKRCIVDTLERYTGIVATVWEISNGERATEKDSQAQGFRGLYRGWRVGAWSALGLWGAGTMAGVVGSADIGEF